MKVLNSGTFILLRMYYTVMYHRILKETSLQMRDMLDNKQTLPNSFIFGNKVFQTVHLIILFMLWWLGLLQFWLGLAFFFSTKVDFYFNKAKILIICATAELSYRDYEPDVLSAIWMGEFCLRKMRIDFLTLRK